MKMPTAMCDGRVVVELISSTMRDEVRLLFPSGVICYVLREAGEAWPVFVERVRAFADKRLGY